MGMQASVWPFGSDRLSAALEAVDMLPLTLSLIHLTGDDGLLSRIEGAGPGGFASVVDAEQARLIRGRLLDILQRPVEQRRPLPAIGRAGLESLMRIATDFAAPDDYFPMLLEQAGFDAPRTHVPFRPAPSLDATAPKGQPPGAIQVAIIGAGMSGICAAIEFKRQGIPFVILESASDLGGTWFKNRYPGCGVDTPSFFYAYSFEPNAEWSHYFAKREEIVQYFAECVDKYGIREHIRFETEVLDATFCEERAEWHLTVRDADGRRGKVVSNALVAAVGQLNIPARPAIPGLDSFPGLVVHTAEWEPGMDVAGKRVAMIGAGASAMQVAPTIAPEVAQLSVFQRSPHWILPNPNYHVVIDDDLKWLLANLPFLLQWQRVQQVWAYGDAVFPALERDPGWAASDISINAVNERYRRNMERYLKQELADAPDLIERSLPSYPPYGKRVLLDNGWFKTLKRPNVSLVTDPIAQVEPEGVRTRDGTLHPADAIVLATGFQATRMLQPVAFKGVGGVDLHEVWQDDNPRAYLGITVPRFPNLFILYGPNTNLGYGGSAIFHGECQVRYVTACLRAMAEQGWASLECRQSIHDSYNEEVDRLNAQMVWSSHNVSNWYKNSKGRVSTNSPWRLLDYWRKTRQPDFSAFVIRPKMADAAPRADQPVATSV